MYKSIWFWWLVTTTVYLLFNMGGYPGDYPSTLGHLAGFVGVFVPYGFLSAILLVTPMGIFSVIVFLASMFFVEKKFNEKNYSLGKRILMNLLALLVLTVIVDLVRQTPFQSWAILFNGSLNLSF